ncbi:MAG TPA: glycosyltransferase [Phycisphaerae bacterium]|nr:glycosyltransferase [Phycisphaerae bacterium]
MPRFSIIVPHYQGTIPHSIFLRGIASLQAQTLQDFELLVYHDGPLLDATVEFPVPVIATARRFNDFGHSLRDRGIREATGEYIVHFNPDNLLYPHALQTIAEEIARPSRLYTDAGQALDTNDIIIFPILMHGLLKFRHLTLQSKTHQDFYIILTAIPPVVQNIDAMQLVMKRSLWLAEGGWSDTSELSDGLLYERFCGKYGYRHVGPVLGEHF